MEHGLDACGTTMEYDADAETINFTVSSIKKLFNLRKKQKIQNEMTIPSQLIDGTIFTSAPLSWNFQCSYATSIDITSDEMSMDASSRTGGFSGVGQFDVEMRTVTQK